MSHPKGIQTWECNCCGYRTRSTREELMYMLTRHRAVCEMKTKWRLTFSRIGGKYAESRTNY